MTSRLVVETFSIGTPGRVLMSIKAQGPVELSNADIARVLRTAAEVADRDKVKHEEKQ
jgi:hypothetical protein